ncbi:hypothetical protein CsatB_008725 [Cannabis sativa]
MSANPNSIWRSILETQSLIKWPSEEGGLDVDVGILEGAWLLDDSWVTSHHPTLINKKVVSFIVSGRFKWDDRMRRWSGTFSMIEMQH